MNNIELKEKVKEILERKYEYTNPNLDIEFLNNIMLATKEALMLNK